MRGKASLHSHELGRYRYRSPRTLYLSLRNRVGIEEDRCGLGLGQDGESID